ncbi:ImcF-related family protein [Paraburkholderia bryophila]|uniref:ImcF-related family protein n=1 Tax=Burkholderiaceae TaxID=119060 RepID=UPI0005502376|nr:ImcF-related family protein [Burkholderia sp. 9120]
MTLKKVSGYWILIFTLTAFAALFVYFDGVELDPSPYRRVAVVLTIGVIALLARAHLASAWRFAAHHAPSRKKEQYERDPSARIGAAKLPEVDLTEHRYENLALALRNRHGWRWRYRDRWVLVVGDSPLIERLAPGLTESGYAIVGGTVLLCARPIGDRLDTAWLERIRRTRRRCPVDAMAIIVRTRIGAQPPFDDASLVQRLARHAHALRWSAPAYVVNIAGIGGETSVRHEVIGCTWSTAQLRPDAIEASLQGLANDLAELGVMRLTNDAADSYAAGLSTHIAWYRSALSALVVRIGRSRVERAAIHGVLFTPLFDERNTASTSGQQDNEHASNADHQKPENTLSFDANRGDMVSAIWQTIAAHSRRFRGRPIGLSAFTSAAWIATACVACWIAGTNLSGFTHRATIQTAAATTVKLSSTQDPTDAALALDSLQKQLDTLDVRQRDGTPWYTRFGLNRNADLLAALWPRYEVASNRILVQPIRAVLEARLRQLSSLSDAEIVGGGDRQITAAHATLKTYLMLARPEHTDAKFLTAQLLAMGQPTHPQHAALSDGAWRDLQQRLVTFYADHLGHRASSDDGALAIVPDASLVSAVRQTLIGVIGLQNSTDVLYRQILDENRGKYPPLSLATLLGDTSSRGLFNTTATLPGVFTRAAWDERISKAIDAADEQRSVGGDWVLSDPHTSKPSASTLKAELRQRYFNDYARAWQQFLNSIRWQQDATLSGTIDQLTLLADPQRSPLGALMKVIVYQGHAGALGQSLSDTLIDRAQQLVGAAEQNPSKATHARTTAPLATAFGPLLHLAGGDDSGGSDNNDTASAQFAATVDLSVQRYLERVTAMRLKLQQIMTGSDPDASSRAAAQAVLQGRTSDIADSRDYASRVAASLGEQWTGFGDLLQQPLDQTWRVVLQPAAASLNDVWRNGVVADWNKVFAGRYPFADSDNDASLPEMGRFMRMDNGVIAQFVTTQLAGIVERQGDRWVLAQGANRTALTVDPTFLAALNKLTRVSTVLFPSGEAHVRFELRGVPTAGVTDTRLVLSGRELHYFNQQESWTPFVWPGDTLENHSRIEWQTEQGDLRTALDVPGRFGPIRLFERASVTPQDSARYLISWSPDQSAGLPLNVQLRSEVGKGPLDVLALRHFSLPSRIFIGGGAKAAQKLADASAPPLPPAALAAAKHAATPLPEGATLESE